MEWYVHFSGNEDLNQGTYQIVADARRPQNWNTTILEASSPEELRGMRPTNYRWDHIHFARVPLDDGTHTFYVYSGAPIASRRLGRRSCDYCYPNRGLVTEVPFSAYNDRKRVGGEHLDLIKSQRELGLLDVALEHGDTTARQNLTKVAHYPDRWFEPEPLQWKIPVTHLAIGLGLTILLTYVHPALELLGFLIMGLRVLMVVSDPYGRVVKNLRSALWPHDPR